MESASYCKFLASFYKLTRKLDRSTILHASVCKWFSAFQDSKDSRYHCYVYPVLVIKVLVSMRNISTITLSCEEFFQKTNIHFIYVATLISSQFKLTLKLLELKLERHYYEPLCI